MVVPGSIPNMIRSFANLFLYFAGMISISNKSKQFLIAAAKLLIVAAAFYFIYVRLADDDALDRKLFFDKLEESFSPLTVFILLLLSFLNRFLEILKWQNLVSVIRIISIWEATKQVLGALTLSVFTPNGIGEYGAKALFFEKEKTKKVVFLNLVCNGIQMVLTIIFGVFGLLYFNSQYHVITDRTVGILFGAFCMLLLISFGVKRMSVKGYSIDKLMKKIGEIPKGVHQKNIFLAVCRYVVFSHQYYFLFAIFGVELPYLMMMAAICSVYFLSSALPTFQFFDFAIKGSVAVYFFSLLGVNEWIPVFVTTIMWLLNVVLPVIAGSYFVISFKPQWKQ